MAALSEASGGSRLVIAGSPPELGRLMGRLLCGFDRLVNGTAEQATLEEGSSMVLETKYYKATVSVECGMAGGDESPVGAHLAVSSSAAANESAGSFSLPESESTDESIPVRLLVVVRRACDPELSDEARYACAVWALEHSCEFVYVDTTADLVSTWNDREKDGLPRVVEALQANMWSSMLRKESKDGHLKGAVPPTVLSSPSSPAPPATTSEKPNSENQSIVDILSSAGPAAEELSQEERMLECFAGLVADARAQRDAVLAGNISDQQRRDRAAAFAMQFSKMLDDGEDEDEDEDEGGSDSQG